MKDKSQIQESHYHFPYHYIPRADGSVFKPSRILRWGYEYVSYIEYLKQKVLAIQPKSLLDVGCGDGRFLYELQIEQIECTGIDTSERAIAFAKAFNPQTNFFVGAIEGHTKEYDCLTCIEVLEHIPPENIDSFLKGMAQSLKQDGTLILSVPADTVPVNEKHFQHFSGTSLENTLSPYFEVKKIEYVNAKGFLDILIRFLITNRFFVLNQYSLLNALYYLYKKHNLRANKKTGKRIIVHAKKS